MIAFSYCVLGSVALAEEDHAGARQRLQESIPIYRETMELGFLGQVLALLAIAERGLDDLNQAKRHVYEALQIAADVGPSPPLIYAYPATALLLIDRGEVERAVELYALALRDPFVAHSRWFEDVAGRHIDAVAKTLPPEVVVAAQERGQGRDLWTTAKELLAELEG